MLSSAFAGLYLCVEVVSSLLFAALCQASGLDTPKQIRSALWTACICDSSQPSSSANDTEAEVRSTDELSTTERGACMEGRRSAVVFVCDDQPGRDSIERKEAVVDWSRLGGAKGSTEGEVSL